MIKVIMESAILLSLLTSFCYGIAGPLVKYTCTLGASTRGLCLMYGIGGLLLTINWTNDQSPLFKNPKAAFYAFILGLLVATAFRTVSRAYSLPTGHISLIVILVAAHPIIASPIGLIFFKEASQVNLPRLIFFSVLVLVGVVGVISSIKPT